MGVPATLETLLTSTAYIVNNNLAVGYGELTVAAMGIAQKILSLGNYVYQGFAAGTQPIMGYNYGAKNYQRMIDVLKAGIMVCSGTELCIMAVYGIFAPQLIGIFTESPEVIATGSRVLRTIMWILPFVGSGLHEQNVFPGHGKAPVRVCDYACAAVVPLCAAAAGPEQGVRLRRHDLGAAVHGSNNDGGVRGAFVPGDQIAKQGHMELEKNFVKRPPEKTFERMGTGKLTIFWLGKIIKQKGSLPEQAERALILCRPMNLIWIMPT